MAFQMNYQDPSQMILRNLLGGQEFGQNMRMNPLLVEQQQLANQMSGYKNQYEGQRAKFYPQFIQAEMAKAQAEPGEIRSRAGYQGAMTDKIRYMMSHPGYMGGASSKDIQALMDLGIINRNSLNGGYAPTMQGGQGGGMQGGGGYGGQPPMEQQAQPEQSSMAGNQQPMMVTQQQRQEMPEQRNMSGPFNTGNPIADAILNKPFIETAYRQKQTEGYNWSHMTAEQRNSISAQGNGMGIDPVKMSNYINKGMDLRQIAAAEGLDPDNIPPPIYPPTTATKTRVQQVEQVAAELNYLESATSAAIKPYADTFANYSPERIKDMLSNNPEAQKRFGRYIGALSIQTGLATGRAALEGTSRPGIEIMREVKNSALKGIDQHSPIKMTKIAFEESQRFINQTLHKGAKIRTVTGMNPYEKIMKGQKEPSSMNEQNDPLGIR